MTRQKLQGSEKAKLRLDTTPVVNPAARLRAFDHFEMKHNEVSRGRGKLAGRIALGLGIVSAVVVPTLTTFARGSEKDATPAPAAAAVREELCMPMQSVEPQIGKTAVAVSFKIRGEAKSTTEDLSHELGEIGRDTFPDGTRIVPFKDEFGMPSYLILPPGAKGALTLAHAQFVGVKDGDETKLIIAFGGTKAKTDQPLENVEDIPVCIMKNGGVSFVTWGRLIYFTPNGHSMQYLLEEEVKKGNKEGEIPSLKDVTLGEGSRKGKETSEISVKGKKYAIYLETGDFEDIAESR